MKIPIRKCLVTLKISIVLILVITVLGLFEFWRGGRRKVGAFAVYGADSPESEFERQIAEDEARVIPGLGEGGMPAYLMGQDRIAGEESLRKLAINVHLSDRISFNRTLRDVRNDACERVIYSAELPSVSVVIIFHNEPYSVVLRTVWSVLNSVRRTHRWYSSANYIDSNGAHMNLGYKGQDPSDPFLYLKEIILVDDNSTLPELKEKLSHYVGTRMPNFIKILRLPERLGLIKARLAGARYSTGDVLVFLDAHCETQRDWLRPLLQRIKDGANGILVPIIDVIDPGDLHYAAPEPWTEFQVSFFRWGPVFDRGLMAARMSGARAARGSVLIFLDAHCEVQSDWLRPLLQRLKEKKDAIVSPVIDVINQETFELDAADYFQIGGFSFDGHFNWIEIPSWEKMRRGTDISPTWSPTMAGGLFAVDRAYFWSIGGYDEQMRGWGGENLEMSFRVWQCGGSIEIIPCSRVGHVFRAFHPFRYGEDTHGINTARAASVWMDDYAELYYLYRPDLRDNSIIGDLTHRKILREKLKCKSFDWYLQNIYREKYVPLRDSVAFGRFRNPITGLCLDSLQTEVEPAIVGLYPCHGTLQPSQQYSLSHSGQLRDEQLCVTVPNSRDDKVRRIVRTHCHEGAKSQEWRILETGQIRHEYTGLCLSADSPTEERPSLKTCVDEEKQKWTQDLRITPDGALYYDSNIISASQMENLKHLPKLSRLSRSLQQKVASIDDKTEAHDVQTTTTSSSSIMTSPAISWQRFPVTTFPVSSNPMGMAQGTGDPSMLRNRKKTRNNFLLKILRSLSNGTEQHLEMSIFCKHQKLFPNNSFVRDLVTMFNKYNITVINKGRIFERNRVVALAGRDRPPQKRTRFQTINLEDKREKPSESEVPQMKVLNIEITTEEVTTTRHTQDTTDDWWYMTTDKPDKTKSPKKGKKSKKKKKKSKLRTKTTKKHTLQPVMHSSEVETTSPTWRRESYSNEREQEASKAKRKSIRHKARNFLKRARSRTNDVEAVESVEGKQAAVKSRKDDNADKSAEQEVDSDEPNTKTRVAPPTAASSEARAQGNVIDANQMENFHDKSVYFEEDMQDRKAAKKANIRISGGKIKMLSLDLQEKPQEITVFVNKKPNATTRQDPPELQHAYEELKNYQLEGPNPRRKSNKKELELAGTDGGDTDHIGKILININGTKLEEEDDVTDEMDEVFKDVKRVMLPTAATNKTTSKPGKRKMTYKVSMQNEDDDSDEGGEED